MPRSRPPARKGRALFQPRRPRCCALAHELSGERVAHRLLGMPVLPAPRSRRPTTAPSTAVDTQHESTRPARHRQSRCRDRSRAPMPRRVNSVTGPRRSAMPADVCKAIASQTVPRSVAENPCSARKSAATSAPSTSNRWVRLPNSLSPMSCSTHEKNNSDGSKSVTPRCSATNVANRKARTLWFAIAALSLARTRSRAAFADAESGRSGRRGCGHGSILANQIADDEWQDRHSSLDYCHAPAPRRDPRGRRRATPRLRHPGAGLPRTAMAPLPHHVVRRAPAGQGRDGLLAGRARHSRRCATRRHRHRARRH